MEQSDRTEALRDAVVQAAESGQPVCIRGGGSKDFYGRVASGGVLQTTGHRGIVDYEPTELVLTARAGTPLAEIEQVLDQQGQMLAFEPPHFGEGATLGGAVSCGLSGPRRAYAGAVRDHVLGVKMINGLGQILQFGGQVMKNVAGYDIARLVCGALGTLGLLLEVSVKVLPRPERELALQQEADTTTALEAMLRWSRAPMPLSAAMYDGERLVIRLSGARQAVEAAAQRIGGEAVDTELFIAVREHRHGFFTHAKQSLWRLSLPPAAAPLKLGDAQLLEWGGAQRWLRSDSSAQPIRDAVAAAGGHATLFRGGDRQAPRFTPLAPARAALERRIKQSFDPNGIFNPGRLRPDW